MTSISRPVRISAAATLAALALALLVRHLAIESHAIGQACEVEGAPLWCLPRLAVVVAFDYSLFGIASLFCGVLSHFRGGDAAATAAMALGAAGLVLYNPATAAVGFLLGLLAAAGARRRAAEGP